MFAQFVGIKFCSVLKGERFSGFIKKEKENSIYKKRTHKQDQRSRSKEEKRRCGFLLLVCMFVRRNIYNLLVLY